MPVPADLLMRWRERARAIRNGPSAEKREPVAEAIEAFADYLEAGRSRWQFTFPIGDVDAGIAIVDALEVCNVELDGAAEAHRRASMS